MTDDAITALLDRARNNRPIPFEHLRDLCEEIDHQRDMNNQLADQSQRLREELEKRGKVLAKIEVYAKETGAAAKDKHCVFALGTICNMVRQALDTERVAEVAEEAS